jgi:hypothetical protein
VRRSGWRCLGVVALLAALATACGGPQGEVVARVTSPFTDAHAQVFDDGLDLVSEPELLEGPWLQTWERELEQRVSDADLVAVVTVRTLRTDVDLDRRQTYRLVTHLDRVVVGAGGEELSLYVHEGERGYATVRSHEPRLLGAQYVAFVKWAAGDSGVRARWHLSPASQPIMERVAELVRRRPDSAGGEGARRRVIIRRD